jgi:REP element-mobilizing transposase RayT
LPHWDITDQPLFVTFRLAGSLPPGRVFPPERLTTGQAFVAMDRLLDHANTGPLFLQMPQIAEVVIHALDQGQRLERYRLHSFVIMPNHVHLLITPNVDATRWLRPLKGFTAHRANEILGRKGIFWQDESYDHLVRETGEFNRIRRYIEGNPVKAGLAATPESFPWSSAH